MTEQPPPSADQIAREVWQKIQVNLTTYTTSYRLLDLMIPIEIAIKEERRLCEQRVSAETERCAQIAAGEGQDHSECGHEAGYMDGRLDARAAILARAPAERPAPPQQKEDLPRRIGVEQLTQDTGQPGCGTERRPSPEAIFHWFDAWLEDRLNDREKTIIREVFYCLDHPEDVTRMKDGRPIPSALASTGEQPDKEEDFGKGSV